MPRQLNRGERLNLNQKKVGSNPAAAILRYVTLRVMFTVEYFIFGDQYFRGILIFRDFIFGFLTLPRNLSSPENKDHIKGKMKLENPGYGIVESYILVVILDMKTLK